MWLWCRIVSARWGNLLERLIEQRRKSSDGSQLRLRRRAHIKEAKVCGFTDLKKTSAGAICTVCGKTFDTAKLRQMEMSMSKKDWMRAELNGETERFQNAHIKRR